MNLKTKIFNCFRSDQIQPVMLLGVYMDLNEFCFIMDEMKEKYKNEIVVKDDEYIFYKLVEKFNCNKNLVIILGEDCGFISKDECYVGVLLKSFDENYSITRMKCELFNDLLKLGILTYEDDLDSIHIFNDMFINEKKEGKKNGIVQENIEK